MSLSYRRPWDDAAFADAKCGAMAAAAKGLPEPVPADETLTKLQRIVEQTEALSGRIAQIFGTDSPESQAAQSLWIILRHDLSVMENQAAG